MFGNKPFTKELMYKVGWFKFIIDFLSVVYSDMNYKQTTELFHAAKLLKQVVRQKISLLDMKNSVWWTNECWMWQDRKDLCFLQLDVPL